MLLSQDDLPQLKCIFNFDGTAITNEASESFDKVNSFLRVCSDVVKLILCKREKTETKVKD